MITQKTVYHSSQATNGDFSRPIPLFSLLDPWRFREGELLQSFQDKKVIVEKADCHVQGTLIQAPYSHLILSTVNGLVLMRDWDVIKEVT